MKKKILIALLTGVLVGCASEEVSETSVDTSGEKDVTIDVTTVVEVPEEKNTVVWEQAESPDFDPDFPLGKFKEYSTDGKLILEGEQVDFNACGMNGGVWKHYNENEKLYLEITYHLYNGEEETCHDTQIDMDIIEYYPTGEIMATKYIHSCYECVQFKVGTWTYYSIDGSVDSVLTYQEPVEILGDTYY